MNARDRTRRTALLCCHCLRNVAFYRAGWRGAEIRNRHQFWVGANGAFLDAAVLEYCKLFAEGDGRHHWRRLVPDRKAFVGGLLRVLGMTNAEYRSYVSSLRRFRNKFVAHLDEEPVMYIPRLRPARTAAAYLLDHLLREPTFARFLPDAPSSAADFYCSMYKLAFSQYKAGA